MSEAVAVIEPQDVSSSVKGPVEPPFPLCEHIKDNGVRCGSPALRQRHFCYFHSRAHRPVFPVGHHLYVPPVMESRAALQVAITHALQAITTGNIQPRHANSIFYGIHLAAKALHMPDPDENAATKPAVVTEIPQHMQAALDGSSAPDPAEFPADRIAAVAGFLLHPDQIAECRAILQEGPRHRSDFDDIRFRLQSHYIARRILRDLGVLRQYSLDPNDFGRYDQEDPTRVPIS